MKIIVDKDTFNELTAKYHSRSVQKRSSFRRRFEYDLLVSHHGMMRRTGGGKVETMSITDGETLLLEHGGREFLCDKSEVSFHPVTNFQLPSRVAETTVQILTYKLFKNSVVSLNYEVLGNGTVRDAWFEVEDGFAGNEMALEDIDTFLAC